MIKKYLIEDCPYALYVAIGESCGNVLEFLNGNGGNSLPPFRDGSNAYKMDVTDGKDQGALVRFKDSSSATVRNISYCSSHVAHSFCVRMGINDITVEGDEIFAALHQKIADDIIGTLRSMGE